MLLKILYSDVDRLPGGRGDKPFVFRIISPTQPTAREIAASTEEDMLLWIQCIRECSCNAERAVCLQFSDDYNFVSLHCVNTHNFSVVCICSY